MRVDSKIAAFEQARERFANARARGSDQPRDSAASARMLDAAKERLSAARRAFGHVQRCLRRDPDGAGLYFEMGEALIDEALVLCRLAYPTITDVKLDELLGADAPARLYEAMHGAGA
jgi:hypothetical protein